MRRTIVSSLIVGGFVLMLIGFFAAAPWTSNTAADSDPAIVGAPLLFLLGTASVVAAAVLYELIPDRN